MSSLDQKRRRLLYQSRYTSTKQTDLMLGEFATTHLPDMDPAALASYEALLNLGDDAIWRMVAEGESPPPELDTTALNALLRFIKRKHTPGHAAVS